MEVNISLDDPISKTVEQFGTVKSVVVNNSRALDLNSSWRRGGGLQRLGESHRIVVELEPEPAEEAPRAT